jgi:chemotaxis protein CheD
MASVRMGEMSVSASSGDELIAIGLGSCIGLALVDRAAGVAGLAHVVLPESQGAAGPPGKFADTAVPELLHAVQQAGAQKSRIEAVLVGGARMFALGGGLDIGARNEAAVRAGLERERVRVHAAATGGSSGRTIRISVGEILINVHAAGGEPLTLLGNGTKPAGRVASSPLRFRLAEAPA